MFSSYEFARPALTVDIVIFALADDELRVMLIQRDLEPFAGHWALPGGFVRVGESLEDAARRELQEETGLKNIYLEQLYTFGHPLRDPREHVVTVSYYALVKIGGHSIVASTDARQAKWFSLGELPQLAFDHDVIVTTAIERLRGKVRYQPIGFELLPRKFTLRQLQHLYELILGRELDKRNFRKKFRSLDILSPLDEFEQNVAHRAAQLFRFDKKKYDRMAKQGFLFEV